MERAGRGNRWPTVSLETGWDSRTGVSGTDRNSDRGARPRSPERGRPDEQAGRHQHGDRTAGRSVARPRFHWAGSGRPGMHLRRGFGAGLSAEQTCRALTVGPFLIFRHAPGEGRGPRVCPGGRSPGRVGGAGPRRVADHSAARPEKFSKNETVRTCTGPRRSAEARRERPRDRDRMAGPFRGDVGRLVRPAYRFFEGNRGRAGAVAESGIATPGPGAARVCGRASTSASTIISTV